MQFEQQLVDSAQPGPQVVGRQAVGDAQIVVQAKVVAGDDEHTLVVDQPLGELGRVDVQVIAGKGDGCGLGRCQVKDALVTVQPFLEDGKASPDIVARPLDEARSHLGRQGQGGELVG